MNNLVRSLKEFFKKTGKNSAVIGLSGGIDSAVCLMLTVKAIGNNNVTAIFMPEEGLTKEENKKDAEFLAKKLDVRLLIIPINSFISSTRFQWERNNIAKMNIKARIRMMILYDFANSNDAIVIGTSNKSEIMLGYGTKYGDAASDVLPIGALYKTEVFKLAKDLGIPKNIINKRPSAELLEGQYDEEDMGITYKNADSILQTIEKSKTLEKFKKSEVDIVLKRMKESEHKRNPIPVIKK